MSNQRKVRDMKGWNFSSMKKMFTTIFSLVMVLAMLFSVSTSAFAVDIPEAEINEMGNSDNINIVRANGSLPYSDYGTFMTYHYSNFSVATATHVTILAACSCDSDVTFSIYRTSPSYQYVTSHTFTSSSHTFSDHVNLSAGSYTVQWIDGNTVVGYGLEIYES